MNQEAHNPHHQPFTKQASKMAADQYLLCVASPAYQAVALASLLSQSCKEASQLFLDLVANNPSTHLGGWLGVQ